MKKSLSDKVQDLLLRGINLSKKTQSQNAVYRSDAQECPKKYKDELLKDYFKWESDIFKIYNNIMLETLNSEEYKDFLDSMNESIVKRVERLQSLVKKIKRL
jgi:hypothetical protein